MTTRIPNDITTTREIVLRNDVADVAELSDFVSGVCVEADCDATVEFGVTLSLEEAVANVMKYAYEAGTEGKIRVVATIGASAITFTVRDSGVAFDPTAAADPDVSLPADEREVGGLGIYLIKHYMDEVRYERIGHENILTLTKKL